jgi:CBS domain-containing protein
MEENDVGCIIVEGDGKLVGIITDRDVALKVAGTARDPLTTRVDEVMSPDPIRISVDRDVRSLTALLHAYHVRRIPIVDSFNEVLGIVTLDDLIGLLGDEMSEIGKAIAEEFAKHDRDE